MDSPKIRFKGYTDAWEQRKLGEVWQNLRMVMELLKRRYGHGYDCDGNIDIICFGKILIKYICDSSQRKIELAEGSNT